jgi:putative ABC transport system permease protein
MSDWAREIRRRLEGLALDAHRETEIVEELAQHLEDRYRELRARGGREDEARAAALAELDSGPQGLAQALGRVERTGAPASPWGAGGDGLVADLGRDLRHGLRLLLRAPGFAGVAVLTLGLGIGANTAIFSVVHAVLLDDLPYREPDRLVTIWEDNRRDSIPRDDVSPANFLDWRERQRVFEAMAFSNPWSFDDASGEEPETVQSALVSEGFFDILGIRPHLGRTFTPEDHVAGRSQVVVLTHGLWQRRFGADPAVLGRVLRLSDQPYQVIGVLPRELELRLHDREREMYAPQVWNESLQRQRRATYLKVIARLRPGVTLAQARAAMEAIAANLARELPPTNAGVGAAVVPLREHLVGRVRPALVVLLGAVGFVLLIACANVANLLLARGTHRARELAIRATLGAARGRLVRQILAESLLLALLGAAAGLAFAQWTLQAIVAASPGHLPRAERIGLDAAVLAFTAGLAILVSLLAGLFPALELARGDGAGALREDARTSTAAPARRRVRSGLVVAEVALALVLMAGAGLLVRSFRALLRVDPGFAPDNAVVLQTFLWRRYPAPEQRRAYVREALDRIRMLPGVLSAGVTTALPLLASSTSFSMPVAVEGRPRPPAGEEPTAFVTVATSGFFEALRIPLLRGRLFDEHDGADARPVAVVSDAMAARLWPGEDPLGKRFGIGSTGPSRSGAPVTLEVIGVVGSTRHQGLDDEPRPEFFLPHSQSPSGSIAFVVRTSGDPRHQVPALKDAVWGRDRAQSFYAVATMDELVAGSLAQRRFNLVLLGSFGALAALLAAVGIYGVLAYNVTQRTHEIGIRMTLGAKRGDVFGLVLGEGMRLAGMGVLLGLAGALALTRLLRDLLYALSPADPLTFLGVTLALGAVAFAACAVPALRAVRIDPVTAMRYE